MSDIFERIKKRNGVMFEPSFDPSMEQKMNIDENKEEVEEKDRLVKIYTISNKELIDSLMAEKIELSIKIEKCYKAVFRDDIEEEHKRYLLTQLKPMLEYEAVLSIRIKELIK